MITFKRISFCATILVAMFIPFGVYAIVRLPIGSADVHEWLPEGRLERQEYDAFVKAFGNDQFLLITWNDCNVDDPRLTEFRERLQSLCDIKPSRFLAVESTDQVLSKLKDSSGRLNDQEARERMEGFMIGENGTAGVLVRPTQRGVNEQAATIEDVFIAADETEGLGRDQLHMAGTIYESFAVDQAAERSLLRLVPPSSILGLLITWCCVRQLRYALCVLVLAGLGQLIAIAFVFYTGNQFSAVLIVLPTLVFMLTLSGAIHLINYYRDSTAVNDPHPSYRAVILGWKPCLLSSLTTVVGMGSLLTSQLAPIREFGLFSAITLTLATLVLLLVFPTAIDWVTRWRPGRSAKLDKEQNERHRKIEKTTRQSRSDNDQSTIVGRYIGTISRLAVPITIAAVLLLVSSASGLARLRASTKFSDMFPTDSRVNQDMNWIEANLGPISTIEVLVKFSDASSLTSFERLQYIARIADALRQRPEVGGVLSAASFVPEWSDEKSIGAVARRAAVRKAIDNNLSKLKDEKWVAESNGSEVWRLISKVSATSSQDYGELVDIVKQTCVATIQDQPNTNHIGLDFTGLTPIMHQTQVTLLQDLGYSFLTAFLLITPMMMWITRSWLGGLLVMIPNVLPVTIVFGMMGWMGFTLDIAGILTASVALGIAVDDTLHFICWYMNALRNSRSRHQAIFDSFRACSASMMHTTLISCVSMMPFLLAEFLPTQQFAKLMISMLTGAIIGDLFVLPALLMSPWGVVIKQSEEPELAGAV